VVHDKIVAVIDVGSNSIKLLVAAAALPHSPVQARFTETAETRISAGISHAKPELTDRAMDAGCAGIKKLLRLAEKFNPIATRIVATSAVRDAHNSMKFIDRIKKETGHIIQVLSGAEEANYIGRGLTCDPQLQDLHNFLQMDLGGGSLELVRFADNTIEQAVSLQLGSVRLSEAFIKDRDAQLASDTQAQIREHVHRTLSLAAFDFQPTNWPILITGGAANVTRAILAARNNQAIDQIAPRLELPTLSALSTELAALPLCERLSVPHLPARRADILPVALLTIETLLKFAGRDATTHSFYNLGYGVAREALKT